MQGTLATDRPDAALIDIVPISENKETNANMLAGVAAAGVVYPSTHRLRKERAQWAAVAGGVPKPMRSESGIDHILFSAAPIDEANLLHWGAAIVGPAGSPYEGGLFEVDIQIDALYPFKPVVLRFLTPIYHPNVSPSCGTVSLRLFGCEWTPSLTISKILRHIAAVLQEPRESSSPAWADAAVLFATDRAAFSAIARHWTHLYAQGI